METKIGTMVFKTKKDAKKFFMDMLEPLPIGHQLGKAEFDLVYALLRFGRSEAYLVLGGGIESMYVDDNTYGGKCFHIRRFDGSCDGVSVPKCISGEPSILSKFTQATRRAVDQDIIDFRNWCFDNDRDSDGLLTCSLTGQKIAREQANVDHAYPMTFNKIRNDFIGSLLLRGVDLDSIEYVDGYGYTFVDPELTMAFQRFHRERATLRIIRRDYNMRAGAADPKQFCSEDP